MSSLFIRSLLVGVAGIGIGLIHQFAPFKGWEEATVDLRLQYRPKTTAPGAVGIVAVGDEDVAYEDFGGWPFDRSIHADVVNILRAFGASHITFDVIFSASDQKGRDEAFASTLSEKNDVTLAYHFEDLHFPETLSSPQGDHFADGKRYGVDVRNSPALVGTAPSRLVFRSSGLGAVNFKPEAYNSTIRRIPLFIQHDGKLYPGLAMETLIQFLRLEPDQIRITPGKRITLVDTPLGALEIPIDERLQYRINYTSEINGFTPAFQYTDLYVAVDDEERASLLKQAIAGKPVIVGNVSTGTSDVVATPIGRLPGMLAQATAISNILTQNHLKFLPSWIQIAGLGIAGLILSLLFRMPSPPSIILAAVTLISCYLAVAYFLAVENWMIPVLPFLELAALAMIGSFWFRFALAKDETGRTLTALKRYVSPSVAERALREEAFQRLEPERREITIFFSDIRGFTNWSEKKEPEEISLVINEYLRAMTELVNEFEGTLDKFIGDGIMVLFNIPDQMENHPARAVEMAIAMQARIRKLNESWRTMGRDPIEVGMGINTGFATVGNFGSEIYSDYTAIGNCVNLAARVESVSGAGEILVSEATMNRICDAFQTKQHGEHHLKGISEPVMVYRVLNT